MNTNVTLLTHTVRTDLALSPLRISDFRFRKSADITNPKSDIKDPLSKFRKLAGGFRKLADNALSIKKILFLFMALLISQNVFAQTQLGADIDAEKFNDFLGHAVSLSADGTKLAIGAPGNDGNGAGSGHVRVYQWAGSAWVQQGADIDGEAAGDNSGFSVSLSADGTKLATGGTGNDGNGSNSGHVRVYQWNGTAWVQQGADIDGEAAEDYLLAQSIPSLTFAR
jgi:hypothetical protein